LRSFFSDADFIIYSSSSPSPISKGEGKEEEEDDPKSRYLLHVTALAEELEGAGGGAEEEGEEGDAVVVYGIAMQWRRKAEEAGGREGGGGERLKQSVARCKNKLKIGGAGGGDVVGKPYKWIFTRIVDTVYLIYMH